MCGNYIHHVVFAFTDALLKVFLDVGLHTLQYCSVDLGNFHMNSVLQIVQCMRAYVYTRLEVYPQ